MPNSFVKAEKVVDTALALLEREIVVPATVWRDAGGSFVGAKNDTISLRLPAYATAKSRNLRAGTAIELGERVETVVPITLDTHIYDAVPVTDAELTLDVRDFAAQISKPGIDAVARKVEDKIADTISGATFPSAHQLDMESAAGESVDVRVPAALRVINRARRLLNDANVPQSERVILMGSAVEEEILNLKILNAVNEAGDDSALRDAIIGRLRGFTFIVSNAIAPEKAYAYHRTAFAMSLQAPVVPAGATWGASASAAGLAMRQLRDYDFMYVRDRLLTDVFVGANVVEDTGEFDEDGKFVPWDGDGSEPDAMLVRAVEITLTEGS